MKLNSKVLDKIRCLYEIANEITKYWVHIESYKFDGFNENLLKVTVYTFIDGKQASLYESREIKLNDEIAEVELQNIIDNIKELITPTTNDND